MQIAGSAPVKVAMEGMAVARGFRSWGQRWWPGRGHGGAVYVGAMEQGSSVGLGLGMSVARWQGLRTGDGKVAGRRRGGRVVAWAAQDWRQPGGGASLRDGTGRRHESEGNRHATRAK